MSDADGYLPQPFGPEFWPAAQRGDAAALWNWHLALAATSLDPEELERAAVQVERGETPEGSLSDPASAALDVCRRHKLDQNHLASQIRRAAMQVGGVRFDTIAELVEFSDGWAGAHALLLAGLGGAAYSWQQGMVRDVSRGYFYTSRLAKLKADTRRNRLYIPLEEVERYGTSEAALRSGKMDEGVRRLMWKQVIRARDSLARGQPLASELPRRLASAYRKCWFGCLEVLGEIERRNYDVWSAPIMLSRRLRIQVWYQSKFGRTTFRNK